MSKTRLLGQSEIFQGNILQKYTYAQLPFLPSSPVERSATFRAAVAVSTSVVPKYSAEIYLVKLAICSTLSIGMYAKN